MWISVVAVGGVSPHELVVLTQACGKVNSTPLFSFKRGELLLPHFECRIIPEGQEIRCEVLYRPGGWYVETTDFPITWWDEVRAWLFGPKRTRYEIYEESDFKDLWAVLQYQVTRNSMPIFPDSITAAKQREGSEIVANADGWRAVGPFPLCTWHD